MTNTRTPAHPVATDQLAGHTVHWLHGVPPQQPWLQWPGSLTRALAACTGQPVTVAVLWQGDTRLAANECLDLGLPNGRWGHAREIALVSGGETLVLARTVVQAADRQLRRQLQGLGTRPLAQLLFPPAGARPGQDHLHPVGQCFGVVRAGALPVRRTRWQGRTGALLVSELFLPAAPAQPPLLPR